MESPLTELAEQHTASFKYPHVVEAALDAWVATESGNWRLSDALDEDIGIEYHRPEQYVLDRKDVYLLPVCSPRSKRLTLRRSERAPKKSRPSHYRRNTTPRRLGPCDTG